MTYGKWLPARLSGEPLVFACRRVGWDGTLGAVPADSSGNGALLELPGAAVAGLEILALFERDGVVASHAEVVG